MKGNASRNRGTVQSKGFRRSVRERCHILPHPAHCFPLSWVRGAPLDCPDPVNPSTSFTPKPASSAVTAPGKLPVGAGPHEKIVWKNHSIVLSRAAHRGYFVRPMLLAPLWRRCRQLPTN
jgi:hypothetical protein